MAHSSTLVKPEYDFSPFGSILRLKNQEVRIATGNPAARGGARPTSDPMHPRASRSVGAYPVTGRSRHRLCNPAARLTRHAHSLTHPPCKPISSFAGSATTRPSASSPTRTSKRLWTPRTSGSPPAPASSSDTSWPRTRPRPTWRSMPPSRPWKRRALNPAS